MTTSNTETNSNSPRRNYLEDMAGLTVAHQAQAMSDLEADRCLLRRDMKARQNKTYGLPQDTLPECTDDDMGVQVGDNKTDNSKVVNNYYGVDPNCPDPTPPVQPCPPRPKLPWWLIALLVIPWIVLASILIGWLLSNYPGENGNGAIVWELDIGAEDPDNSEGPSVPVQPTPPSTQPVPGGPSIDPVPDPVTIQPTS